MVRVIEREELARLCLEEIRLWPGCDSVISVALLAAPLDRFKLRVADYGAASPKLPDRAPRPIEREKLRYYHLKRG